MKKNVAKLPSMKELLKPVSAAPKGAGNAPKAQTASKAQGTPKGASKGASEAQDKGTRKRVFLDLPKGTERFVSASGIEWLRTPKQGDFKRWFQLAPKGTAETGIHGVSQKNGIWTLDIERARVPYRELAGNIREKD